MTSLATYEQQDHLATITLDDGKVNALSNEMLATIDAHLDQAEADGAAVLLTGREGMFTAGFDLKTFTTGGRALVDMLMGGARLAERLLTFPHPTVIASPGHALAAGSFLLLAADVRIGAAGPYKLGLNETQIGLTLPWFVVELARHRLSPAMLDAAVVQATIYDPEAAVTAGYLDRVVAPDELARESRQAAATLLALDQRAYAETKQRLRGPAHAAVHAAIERTGAELEAAMAG